MIKLFQIEDFEMSYGEIEFYIEKEELKMKKAINELLSTNMMHLKNTEYQIDVMAKDYLQLHETPSAEFIEKISNKKKQLNDMLQDIKVKKENSILDPNSILYDYDNKDNKIAAIYLYKALELGRDKNLEDALLMTDRASNVAPNYFECYKIKGFLNANAQNKIDKKTYVNLIALLKEISLMYYDNDAMILLKKTLKNNFNGLKTINHKDINFINNIIEDHKYEINEYIYNELKKFLTDYRKLAKNIIDRDLGVVVYFPRPYEFIANAYNESIYFNVSRLRRSIDVGDIVKFNLKQSTKGDVAINIRKINKTMEDFIDKN